MTGVWGLPPAPVRVQGLAYGAVARQVRGAQQRVGVAPRRAEARSGGGGSGGSRCSIRARTGHEQERYEHFRELEEAPQLEEARYLELVELHRRRLNTNVVALTQTF